METKEELLEIIIELLEQIENEHCSDIMDELVEEIKDKLNL